MLLSSPISGSTRSSSSLIRDKRAILSTVSRSTDISTLVFWAWAINNAPDVIRPTDSDASTELDPDPMAKLPPCDVILADRRRLTLRSGVPADARAYLTFMGRCLADSPYLIQTADELRTSAGEQRAILRRVAASPADALLLAMAGARVVASLDAVSDRRRRLAHVCTFGVLVDPEWRQAGLGSALIAHFLAWAQARPSLEKVELHVHSENQGARALYRRFGFVEEGRRVKAIKYGPDRYMDDVLMGLDLAAYDPAGVDLAAMPV
ncbi:hypothetical protein CKO24_08995 [Rhodothalassium salexigens DSM 2132]|nr:hypothetical protein [Rhodothalassium salexigens DSM 2132]